MEATIRDLRLHTAEVLAAADRGERVTITSRGQARAVLVRCDEGRARAHAERNPAFGMWADRQSAVDDDVRMLRQPRALP
ncbi:type II toxin-antitoxin system Phd/YefM family antitoxin [Thauera mechernichensis]